MANQLLEIRDGSPTGALLGINVVNANGSLVKKCATGTVTRTATDCTGTTVTRLYHDSLNRQVQVIGGTPIETYLYDHAGRRIRKTTGFAATNYLYQGEDIYAEYGGAYSAPTAVYTHGPATDDPLIRLTGTQGPNATAQYYHQDGLGSVVGLSNATGGTVASARYDAWGAKTASSGTLPQYGYTGREPDATGLVYYRARYYDPSQRRFTSRDPIGLAGGINLYAYVGNNPTNYTDPSGEYGLVGAGYGAFAGALSGSITAYNTTGGDYLGALIGGISGGISGAIVGAINPAAAVSAGQIVGGTFGGILGNMGRTSLTQLANNQDIHPLANLTPTAVGISFAGAIGGAAGQATLRIGGTMANSGVSGVTAFTEMISASSAASAAATIAVPRIGSSVAGAMGSSAMQTAIFGGSNPLATGAGTQSMPNFTAIPTGNSNGLWNGVVAREK